MLFQPILFLSIDIRDDVVKTCTYSDKVCHLCTTKHVIKSTYECESHWTELHAIWRLVATGIEIYTELTTCTLTSEVPLSLWKLDDWLLLDVVLTLWDIVDELLDDSD